MKALHGPHLWLAGGAIIGTLLIACADWPAPAVPHISGNFDAPDAAAQHAQRRRAPRRGGVDTIALYDDATSPRELLPRFSSRAGRTLPDLQPPARVWLSEGRAISIHASPSPVALLDAWTPLGPGNVGGRTRIVRYHPTQHNTMFAAGVSGGVWRTDDSGASWRPIAERLTNIAVNAFAIDPRAPAVMYAGTGEGFMREEIRGTGLPLRGGGIFISRDGGLTWERLASTAGPDFHWVNDLELGIGDSRRIYAATRTGVWRSLNGGVTWSRLLETNLRGGCLDLALRPDQPDDVLFASCGSYEQASVYRFPRASRSTDVDIVLSDPGMGRTSIAIAPSNPRIVYALSASNDSGPGGTYRQALHAVFRSDRDGDSGSWERRVGNTDPVKLHTLLLTNAGAAMGGDCAGQPSRNTFVNMGWYVNVIAVDPRDPDRVWAAGVDWFRSDDGGRTWGLASWMSGAPGVLPAFAHVDQHTIAFHPSYDGRDNQTVVIGNDGGVYRSANARGRVVSGPRATCAPNPASIDVRWESLNRGYGVTQFYHGLPYANGTRYLGGAQDNSTPAGSDDTGPDSWRTLLGGDGGFVAVHPTNPNILWAESQWANIARSANGGTSFTSITRGLDPVRSSDLGPDANYLFVTPFVLDPLTPARLWLGGEHVYRWTDTSASWTKASPAMPEGGLVSAIAVSSVDSNRVVAGTTNGFIVWSYGALTTDASADWNLRRPRDGWVTSVAIDPRSPDVVYATYGNFGGAHVFRSTNGGAKWESLDGDPRAGGLPDIPVHSIVVDPDDSQRLYLGTDLGVFVSANGGASWLVEETGFGGAVTEWLAMTRDAAGRKLLFAFTHGRGAWRVEVR